MGRDIDAFSPEKIEARIAWSEELKNYKRYNEGCVTIIEYDIVNRFFESWDITSGSSTEDFFRKGHDKRYYDSDGNQLTEAEAKRIHAQQHSSDLDSLTSESMVLISRGLEHYREDNLEQALKLYQNAEINA